MELPEKILITDVGSTTTKALYFRRTKWGYSLIAHGAAPTTVEAPQEDVMVGFAEAVKRIEESSGLTLIRNGVSLAGENIDAFLSTSSAGGGLQILVSGLARSITAKSAFRAACAAGGVILDVLAVDDGRNPNDKLKAVEELRPDMVLIAGGVEGGDKVNMIRMASMLMNADMRPKYAPDGRMPVLYAGNSEAEPVIESIFMERANFTSVPNLRPRMDEENLLPTRRAIHEIFTEHVMARAPGYSSLRELTARRIDPTPVAVGRMLGVISEEGEQNVIVVDIGGATTDVFSSFDGRYNRTVSANMGMSYSASDVMLEAGVDNVARWLPFETDEREIRNIVAGKSIDPTRLPSTDMELAVEHALAREAIRIAMNTHRQTSVEIRDLDKVDRIKAFISRKKSFREDYYVRMSEVDLIHGSGGVLSAASPGMAAMMLIDSLQPVGITELAVDRVFMMPHLGMIGGYSRSAAYETYLSECKTTLGTCIGLAGTVKYGKKVAEVTVRTERGNDYFEVMGGELKVLPYQEEDILEVGVITYGKTHTGIAGSRNLVGECTGGEVGLIIDARGRLPAFPEREFERAEAVKGWIRTITGEK